MASLDENNVNIKVTTTADGDGIEQTESGLKSLAKTGEQSEGKLTDLTESFSDGLDKVAKVAGITGAGLTLFAKGSVDKLVNVAKSAKDLARQTGMTAVEASELQAAFQRMGLTSDASAMSIRSFSKVIADARTDTGDMGNKLNELHVAVKNADGSAREFDQILYDVADKFQTMPAGAEKTALSMELFGRSGSQMIKVLDGGSEAIQKLEDQAKSLGLTLTTENIGTVDKYIQSQKSLADTTQSLQIQVGLLTAPVLSDFNSRLNETLTNLIGVNAPFRDLTANTLAFGGPILGAVAGVAEFASNIHGAIPLVRSLGALIGTPMIMPAIGVAAALAALGLVIAKTFETADHVKSLGNEIMKSKQAGDEADAHMQRLWKEGTISTQQLQDYIRKTGSVAEQTKQNLYSGFFGPMQESLDSLFVMITGTQEQYRGTGFGGYATGGFTGSGGMNEVAGVVHKGEYVLRQDQVDQRTGQPKASAMSGGGASHVQTITIQNLNLTTPTAVKEFFNINDRDAQLAQMGLSPTRGY